MPEEMGISSEVLFNYFSAGKSKSAIRPAPCLAQNVSIN